MKTFQVFLLSVILVGCSVGPKYVPPHTPMPVPCKWNGPLSQGMNVCSPTHLFWWESLNDPVLNALIQRAAYQNLDLYIATTRLLEVRTIKKENSEASIYPHIDGSTAIGHLYSDKNTRKGILKNRSNAIKRNIDFFEFGFDAEWELDLFGAGIYELNALNAKIDSSEEALRDVWITLSAEIARNYIELRGFQQRLSLIMQMIENQKETVHLTQELLNTGFVNTIDLRQVQEALSTLSAELPLIQLSIDQAIHRLSILLGYSPNQLFCELSFPHALPIIPFNKPIGIPSELLRRRPDIRKAERDLAEATELVSSAVAALFPRISLEGFVGDITTKLMNPFSATLFLAPQLLFPVFNSKSIKEDICINKIKARRAYYEYRKTVLEALEETENAISAFHYEQQHNGFLAQAQRDNNETYQLTLDLYQRGLKDYLEVLRVQQAFLTSEDTYIQSQIALLLHYIALYKALGGGWRCIK